jgi:hypothetical protein
MSGGGLEDAPQWAYDHHFRPPATGMVYTPPQYSDHIAVSLLLRAEALDDARAATAAAAAAAPGGGGASFKFNAATRKCQPHATTTTITAFFGKAKAAAPPAAGAAADGSAAKRPANSALPELKPNKAGLHSFFKAR